jgi:hypothetical protein
VAHGLEAIDWSAPWLAPWRAAGQTVAQGVQCGASCAQALTDYGQLHAVHCPVHFVAPHELSAQESIEAYEAYIYRTRGVPTRDGLHDFFNGLCWLTFPQTKVRLNQLQAQQIARSGVHSVRGPTRDGITVFDENAAFLQAPDALWSALEEKNWERLFSDLRPLWAQSHLVLFGHALLEKLVQPRKGITAHVYRVTAQDHSVQAMDTWMAAELSAEKLARKPFAHLPILGVPGWWADNEESGFYDDAFVFRSKR